MVQSFYKYPFIQASYIVFNAFDCHDFYRGCHQGGGCKPLCSNGHLDRSRCPNPNLHPNPNAILVGTIGIKSLPTSPFYFPFTQMAGLENLTEEVSIFFPRRSDIT